MRRDLLPPFRTAAVPRFPGLAAALGPAVMWMALAQGSGARPVPGVGLPDHRPVPGWAGHQPFLGTVTVSFAVLLLNHRYLPRRLPAFARPGVVSRALLGVCCLSYLALAAAYLWIELTS